MGNAKRPLVLASTSRYRRELLERLGCPFEVAAPGVDETARPGEGAGAVALRLAEAKARAVAARYADALVIGSDQVADCNGHHVGKPGHREGALEQLRMLSGQTVTFHTGIETSSSHQLGLDVPSSDREPLGPKSSLRNASFVLR